MAADWFYRDASGEHGPISGAEVQDLAARGFIRADTPVRRGPTGNFVAASTINGLRFLVPVADDPDATTGGAADGFTSIRIERRYGVLASLSVIYFFAGLLLLCTAIGAFVLLIFAREDLQAMILLGWLLSSVIGALSSFAAAQMIQLARDVEAAARATHQSLEQLRLDLHNRGG